MTEAIAVAAHAPLSASPGKSRAATIRALYDNLLAVRQTMRAGHMVEAERMMTQMILSHVGRPDAPSLFRIFQATPDFTLAPRVDEFGEAVEQHNDLLLKACFMTLVGPWAMNNLTTDAEGQFTKVYVSTCDQFDNGKKVRLFEDRSETLLWIVLNNPVSTCNYRCSYCFLNHDKKVDPKKIELIPQIIDRLALIPRPIAVTYGPAGDILAVPAMWPYFKNLAALPNLQQAEIWTNLYRDLDGITQLFPVKRLTVMATYHPSQFPQDDFDKHNEAFFRRVAYLKDNAFDVSVNFVTAKINMPHFDALSKRLKAMGVYLTVNPVQGAYNGYGQPTNGDGKLYPEAYSEQDWLKIQKWTQNELYAYFVINKKAKIRCSAGVDHLDIWYNGNVSRCEHQATWKTPQGYGNILDEAGPLVDKVNRYCWMDGCACKSTIGYAEPLVAEFKREGMQHHYIRREPGEKGVHSYEFRSPAKQD